jgi:ubiquinone/menaquinone biosynthesis C-methylase UbiE
MLSKKTAVPAEFYDEEYFTKGTKSNYGGRFAPYIFEVYYPLAKEFSLRFVEVFEPKKAMVLGCARGYLVRALRERNVEAYGIDISEWAIKNADEKIKDYVYLGNINDMGRWKNGEFDLIIASDVLEHIEKQELVKVLNEIARICGKYVYVYVPVVDNGRDKSHISIFPSEWWIKQFAKRGLMCFSRVTRKQVDGITACEMAFFKRGGR